MMLENCLEMVLRTLAEAGITPTVKRGKHGKIRWRNSRGENRMVVVGSTPKGQRVSRRARSITRRLITLDRGGHEPRPVQGNDHCRYSRHDEARPAG
jgi:hypothetical protein